MVDAQILAEMDSKLHDAEDFDPNNDPFAIAGVNARRYLDICHSLNSKGDFYTEALIRQESVFRDS